jgi:hypothetical protein
MTKKDELKSRVGGVMSSGEENETLPLRKIERERLESGTDCSSHTDKAERNSTN